MCTRGFSKLVVAKYAAEEEGYETGKDGDDTDCDFVGFERFDEIGYGWILFKIMCREDEAYQKRWDYLNRILSLAKVDRLNLKIRAMSHNRHANELPVVQHQATYSPKWNWMSVSAECQDIVKLLADCD